ncbi:hypothetical protein [Streptacidiphilus sp. MAP5-3]
MRGPQGPSNARPAIGTGVKGNDFFTDPGPVQPLITNIPVGPKA